MTWGWWQQDRQEIPKYQDGDDHNDKEDKETPGGANEEKEEDEVETVMLNRSAPATESLPPTIIEEMEEMFLKLGF